MKVKPAVPLSVNVPFVLERVTLTGFEPASASLIEIRLLLPVENTREVSSFVVWAPGTLFTGAWFTDPPLKVTVRVPLGPMTAVQGLVVPEQVVEARSAWPLHPVNVEPEVGVARKVIVAPFTLVEILGTHVEETVCVAASAPVPPQLTGALTSPVLGVTLTVPEPVPAKVRTQFRAATT
jgi:hypothetical protein